VIGSDLLHVYFLIDFGYLDWLGRGEKNSKSVLMDTNQYEPIETLLYVILFAHTQYSITLAALPFLTILPPCPRSWVATFKQKVSTPPETWDRCTNWRALPADTYSSTRSLVHVLDQRVTKSEAPPFMMAVYTGQRSRQ
jgi:hypothetical protein